MKLNRRQLADKIYACFIGKNIGGTIGGPYEGKPRILDVKGFAGEPGEPLPNDDLDLQLVWLRAVERFGPWSINARLLAEYWISFIPPHWNEYGIGKANLKAGLIPPLSGEYKNTWKHSNGAWIRTEIWSCMAPGNPDIAVRYAYEDACIDHGAGEGTWAAMFVAAVESAAFVEHDIKRLIDIGLSKIPADCRMARSIKLLLRMYDEGADWKDTRNALVEDSADLGWFMAPANVSFAFLGLLYGEGDFKQSMLYAVNCGDDTDCTAATAGALMGILGGTEGIPGDWRAYIGDRIVTVAIDRGSLRVPKTCTDLAERVLCMAPVVLMANQNLQPSGFTTMIGDGETEISEEELAALSNGKHLKMYESRDGLSVTGGGLPADVRVTYDRMPEVKEGETLGLTVRLHNNVCMPNHAKVHWHLPEGWSVDGPAGIYLPHRQNSHSDGNVDIAYTLHVGKAEAHNRVILDVEVEGRPTPILMMLVIIG